MSGFAYNLNYSTAITPVAYVHSQESAGKVGKIIGVIAAVAMPFAAPAIWGAIAGSTAIGASIAGGLTGAFGAAASSIIGSAAVGAIANAGIAYASGARGGDVWRAAGMGALQGGGGAFMRAAPGMFPSTTPTTAGLNAVGGTGPVSLAPTGAATAAGAPANMAIGATTATGAAAGGGIMSQVSNILGNLPIDRIGAALLNGIVNNESQDRLDALVAQQRAALQGLNAQEQAAYGQRMQAAQAIIANAQRNNPEILARMRMADVMGIMNREHDQAKRNIAVRQGGSLDAGQAKAYERSGRLEIGRQKVKGWGEGYQAGVTLQNQGYAAGAGLMTGPNFQPWRDETELLAGQERARREGSESTWGGISDAVFGPSYRGATSPDPSANNDDEEQAGIFTGWRG